MGADDDLIARDGKTNSVASQENWVDLEKGEVDRRIFSDDAIYQKELKRIFARGWNFMCHESQLAEAGSFFMNYIGEDHVIVVKDRAGIINVLLNSCPHRGNSVCRVEQGKTRSFFCSYHGWNFDLDGALVAVPGLKDFYKSDLNKAEWGLAKAPKVSSYRGFVFASLDDEAPELEVFLGWVGKLSLDMLAERGELEVVNGIQKNRLQCNWKLAVDNLFDWYHPKVSHASAFRTGIVSEASMEPNRQMVLLGEFGHAIGGPGFSEDDQAAFLKKQQNLETNKLPDGTRNPNSWRASADAAEQLGPVGIRSRGHPNVFPNLWVALNGMQLCLRIPKGPLETELWWFTFVEKDMDPVERRRVVQLATHVFGPAGLLEQDDGENWSHCTRGSMATVTAERPLNFSMSKGHDQLVEDPSGQHSISGTVNEHGQLWTYRSWQEWMHAEDWPQLMANHSAEPKAGLI